MTAVFSPNCDYTLWSIYLDPFRQADSVVTAHFQKDLTGADKQILLSKSVWQKGT